MDENKVELKDTKGFNVLNGISIAAHYTSWSEEDTRVATDALLKEDNIVALPEEDTIYINGDNIELVGTRPYYVFNNGTVNKFDIESNKKVKDNIYNYI